MKGLIAILKIVLFFAAFFGAILGVLYYAFWERTVIPHNGMAPTLFEGDEVLYWKGSDNIRRGEIVICENPERPGQLEIGRVIAAEGDRLDEDRSTIRLNGKSITSRTNIRGKVSFAPDGEDAREFTWASIDNFGREYMIFRDNTKGPEVYQERIEPGYLYLLSDNFSAYPSDSRRFGVVDQSTCIGEVFLRLKRGYTPPAGIPYDDLTLLD